MKRLSHVDFKLSELTGDAFMSYRFGIGEKVKAKEHNQVGIDESNGTVIDRWADTFNRKMYKVQFENDSYSYNSFHREDDLIGLWDIHGVNKPECECGAVKTLNPMNHSRWCPLAKAENDN